MLYGFAARQRAIVAKGGGGDGSSKNPFRKGLLLRETSRLLGRLPCPREAMAVVVVQGPCNAEAWKGVRVGLLQARPLRNRKSTKHQPLLDEMPVGGGVVAGSVEVVTTPT